MAERKGEAYLDRMYWTGLSDENEPTRSHCACKELLRNFPRQKERQGVKIRRHVQNMAAEKLLLKRYCQKQKRIGRITSVFMYLSPFPFKDLE